MNERHPSSTCCFMRLVDIETTVSPAAVRVRLAEALNNWTIEYACGKDLTYALYPQGPNQIDRKAQLLHTCHTGKTGPPCSRSVLRRQGAGYFHPHKLEDDESSKHTPRSTCCGTYSRTVATVTSSPAKHSISRDRQDLANK